MSNNFTGNHEVDPSVWAKEFCKQNPQIDEGLMLGWFANAIMAGHDVATSKCTDEIDRLKAMKAELVDLLDELVLELAVKAPGFMTYIGILEKVFRVCIKARGEE